MAMGRRTKTTKGTLTGRARPRGQSSTARHPGKGTSLGLTSEGGRPITAVTEPVFERAASTLHAMGIVENLRLLISLLSGPRSVVELAMATGKSHYLVARRLAKLSKMGLVVIRSRAHCELRGERSRRLVRFAQKRLREAKAGRLPGRSLAADVYR